MGTEERAEQQMAEYAKLAKENKGVDAAALMVNALEMAQREEVEHKKKRRAYLVSVALPPLGLLFAAYYFWKGGSSERGVAINCVILTAVSLFIGWGVMQLFASSVTPEQTKQIESLNAADLQRLLQQ